LDKGKLTPEEVRAEQKRPFLQTAETRQLWE
jgi:hypothetical protein